MKPYLIILAVALLSACDASPSPAPATPPPPNPSAETTPLQGRLDAALGIAGGESRDDALEKVALDAAEAGNAPIVKQAIQGIAVVGTKDRTAEACALALAKHSEPKAANEVAQLISSTEARDRALSTIAKGR